VKKYIIILLLAIVAFSGCKKEEEPVIDNRRAVMVTSNADNIAIVIFVNGTIVENTEWDNVYNITAERYIECQKGDEIRVIVETHNTEVKDYFIKVYDYTDYKYNNSGSYGTMFYNIEDTGSNQRLDETFIMP
jgi:hypothetical protein